MEERVHRRRATVIGFALVGVLFFHMAIGKFRTVRQVANFDRADDTGFLWTENAFHYRYAKMAAMGQGIPAVDVKMQYPEGMHVFRDEMPMMERFAGAVYRHLPAPRPPFHVFLMLLVCFYSSAVLFPAYVLSAILFRSATAGVVTSLFYAFTYSFIGGVVLGAYVRQDFALPFLFAGTVSFLAALDSGKTRWSLLAAALFGFSFVSWHLSQFYYLVLVTGLLPLYFLQPAGRDRIASALSIVTASLLAVSLVALPLRAGRFPLSLVMLTSYALIAQHLLARRRPLSAWMRAAAFAGILAVLLAATALVSGGHYARYSHVYALILDKIRFLGVKPADPSLMGFESRVMWTSSFLSPSPRVMAGWLGGAWVAGIAGAGLVVRDAFRSRWMQVSHGAVLWMGAVFVVLFALIQRMDVFAGFFVCVLAGRCVPGVLRSRRGVLTMIGLAILLAASVHIVTHFYMYNRAPPAKQIRPLIGKLRERTGSNDVILASFPLSPVVCAYADRPVVVHSKFENRRVREKVGEFHDALFGDEDGFLGFCRTYDVQYFIYEPAMLLDTSPVSLRYMADRLELDDGCVAVLMGLMPGALRHFLLVYQDEAYRIFRVLDQPRRQAPVPFENLPVYDSRRYRREDLKLREKPIRVRE